jgi:hypothetical protein
MYGFILKRWRIDALRSFKHMTSLLNKIVPTIHSEHLKIEILISHDVLYG